MSQISEKVNTLIDIVKACGAAVTDIIKDPGESIIIAQACQGFTPDSFWLPLSTEKRGGAVWYAYSENGLRLAIMA